MTTFTADAKMVNAWAKTLTQVTEEDLPTLVFYLGLEGALKRGPDGFTLDPKQPGTSSMVFQEKNGAFASLHVVFDAPIRSAELEQWLGPGTTSWNVVVEKDPYRCLVEAKVAGGLVREVTLRRMPKEALTVSAQLAYEIAFEPTFISVVQQMHTLIHSVNGDGLEPFERARAWLVDGQRSARVSLDAVIARGRSAGLALEDAPKELAQIPPWRGGMLRTLRAHLDAKGLEAVELASAAGQVVMLVMFTSRLMPLVRAKPGDQTLKAISETVRAKGIEAIEKLDEKRRAWVKAHFEKATPGESEAWLRELVEMLRVRPSP